MITLDLRINSPLIARAAVLYERVIDMGHDYASACARWNDIHDPRRSAIRRRLNHAFADYVKYMRASNLDNDADTSMVIHALARSEYEAHCKRRAAVVKAKNALKRKAQQFSQELSQVQIEANGLGLAH